MCVETGLQGNDDLIKVMKLVKCRELVLGVQFAGASEDTPFCFSGSHRGGPPSTLHT